MSSWGRPQGPGVTPPLSRRCRWKTLAGIWPWGHQAGKWVCALPSPSCAPWRAPPQPRGRLWHGGPPLGGGMRSAAGAPVSPRSSASTHFKGRPPPAWGRHGSHPWGEAGSRAPGSLLRASPTLAQAGCVRVASALEVAGKSASPPDAPSRMPPHIPHIPVLLGTSLLKDRPTGPQSSHSSLGERNEQCWIENLLLFVI